MVGTLGTCGERTAEVTPSARKRPLGKNPITVGKAAHDGLHLSAQQIR